MHYPSKKRMQNASIPVIIGSGVLLTWGITALTAVAVTCLIAWEKLSEGAIAPAAVIAVAISVFSASIVITRKNEEKRLLVCFMIGGVYYVSLLCCNALFFDGSYRGMLGAALTIMGCSLVAGLLGNSQKGRGARRYKMRFKA